MKKNNQHWTDENYKQRITRKELQEMLINNDDYVIFHGRLRKLIMRPVAAGIYEIFKAPIKEIK